MASPHPPSPHPLQEANGIISSIMPSQVIVPKVLADPSTRSGTDFGGFLPASEAGRKTAIVMEGRTQVLDNAPLQVVLTDDVEKAHVVQELAAKLDMQEVAAGVRASGVHASLTVCSFPGCRWVFQKLPLCFSPSLFLTLHPLTLGLGSRKTTSMSSIPARAASRRKTFSLASWTPTPCRRSW